MSLNKIAADDLKKVRGGKEPIYACACMPIQPGQRTTSYNDGYGAFIRNH